MLGPALARVLALWAVAALVIALGAPVATRVGAAVTGLRFLIEFLTEGRRAWLSAVTAPPLVEPLGEPATAGLAAPDLWRPGAGGPGPWPGVVLVHGLTPEGKHDPRLAWTADRLARAGFAVAVPDLPSLRAQRLRPDDAGAVRDALVRLAAHPAARGQPLAVVAVSVGLGPAALALGEPGWAGRIRLVLALGGYAEARELVRYFTTGAYGFGPAAGRRPVDPALGPAFLAQNLDLLPDARDRAAVAAALRGRPPPPDAGPGVAAALALLENREPARVDALLEALPAETRGLLDTLSPARHLGRSRARLLLVHGRDDPAIPFTETLRLAAAVPGRTRPVVVDLIGHVEGQAPAWRRLVDLLRLWSVCYELLAV
jgi:pimeloyl-ACP methyl ester carboxylesterase